MQIFIKTKEKAADLGKKLGSVADLQMAIVLLHARTMQKRLLCRGNRESYESPEQSSTASIAAQLFIKTKEIDGAFATGNRVSVGFRHLV